MAKQTKSVDRLIDSLEERTKELNCLYKVEEILNQPNLSLEGTFNKIVKIIPTGMQYPELCQTKIIYQDLVFTSKKFKETPWSISENITVQDRTISIIKIYYTEEHPMKDEGPFSVEEQRVLNSIANRLSHYIMYQRLKLVYDTMATTKEVISEKKSEEWRVILELVRRTDPDEYTRITRKMLNHLVWRGLDEAETLMKEFIPLLRYSMQDFVAESNKPMQKSTDQSTAQLSHKVFEIAQKYLSDEQILAYIQAWVQQDKTSFLVRAVTNINSSLSDITDAIRRYFQITPEGLDLAPSAKIGVRAALIRRFFTDQLEFVIIAKNFVRISDFNELAQNMISPTGSHGKLGGKSAGLFLATRILETNSEQQEILKDIKTPKTWYITSDTMINFMHYNNLEELLEQKYKPIEEIRKEYPHVVQLFKNSHFPSETVQGLSMALDDFGNKPLIVRSSSLLEDRLGSAFSGKYKSLFLVNQGDKNERLEAVLDAMAEVYASTLGPDPMQYRSERGLTDFHEEMGIMLQEVVGQQVGDYFLPAFAGVAFSNNEFRWSPRIKREDGLIRVVPGLGTRAVDRLSDDYPILIAPGQPGLRANVSFEERIRYTPQKIDVLNLKTNKFETIEIKDLLKRFGNDYPGIEKLTSVYEHNHLKKPMPFQTDFSKDDVVVTFEGLMGDTKFIKQIYTILKTLQNAMASPVDIEFASDSENFYLLQCRPQSYKKFDAPSPIPKDIPKNRTIFTANRFVSNGIVPEITHIVYVDPDKYNMLTNIEELNSVGRAVGRLNQILPKRKFILMGPGRWGSRGDIKLGINVTYSDINNTAVLIEIARKKGNYLPDLSFGTHFFQDLVEASIRYLPLYPDDKGIIFNLDFLMNSSNALSQLLPEFSAIENTVRVIEVPQIANGQVLRILMNADQDKAIGLLAPKSSNKLRHQALDNHLLASRDDHWQWRTEMVEKLALQLNPKKYGIKGIFLVGSTKNTTAQAGSDIDLLINFEGTEKQKKELLNWFEGWSLCLDEMNFLRTGFKAGGLLDIHLVTDEDLANPSHLAAKLNINVEGMKPLTTSSKN